MSGLKDAMARDGLAIYPFPRHVAHIAKCPKFWCCRYLLRCEFEKQHLGVVSDNEAPVCGLEPWSNKVDEKVGGPGWVKIRAVVDSGAGASVGPKSLARTDLIKESRGSKVGQCFTSASGETMRNEGEVVLKCYTESGQALAATFQIADITRPLLSVSNICEKDNLVYFGKRGGMILNLTSGQKTSFGRESGIYVLDLYVRECDVGF